jgi:hypothetical protein
MPIMKRLFLPTAVLAALMFSAGILQGCGQQETSRHAGTWDLDTQVVKDAMMAEIASIENEEEREAMELGMAMMGAQLIDAMNMTLVLGQDGSASSTTSIMGESETVHGTWSASGDMVLIEMEQDGQAEAVAARVTGDTMELLPPEGEEMPFRMIMRKR